MYVINFRFINYLCCWICSSYIFHKKLNKILQEPDWPVAEYVVVIYSIENWIKFFRNQIGLLFHFETYNHAILRALIVICCHSVPFAVTRCDSLSFVVTHCTTRCHSLSFIVLLVVICCHSLYQSLSLVAIRCTTRWHLLSCVAICCTTRCHSLSFVVLTRWHSMYHSFAFLYAMAQKRLLSWRLSKVF